MRGKLGALPQIIQAIGITPADAGKTGRVYFWVYSPRDHPRGCGENEMQVITARVSEGSPPRMRGKLFILLHGQAIIRITPADAGKTRGAVSSGGDKQDHPRGCGENPAPTTPLEKLAGSPPRMRGKPILDCPACAAGRITPADAGKTPVVQLSAQLRQDHPRGCGENPQMPPEARRLWGSPTRMRGKLAEYNPAIITAGITPADAGKTGGDVQVWVIVWDHPRGCGENYLR